MKTFPSSSVDAVTARSSPWFPAAAARATCRSVSIWRPRRRCRRPGTACPGIHWSSRRRRRCRRHRSPHPRRYRARAFPTAVSIAIRRPLSTSRPKHQSRPGTALRAHPGSIRRCRRRLSDRMPRQQRCQRRPCQVAFSISAHRRPNILRSTHRRCRSRCRRRATPSSSQRRRRCPARRWRRPTPPPRSLRQVAAPTAAGPRQLPAAPAREKRRSLRRKAHEHPTTSSCSCSCLRTPRPRLTKEKSRRRASSSPSLCQLRISD